MEVVCWSRQSAGILLGKGVDLPVQPNAPLEDVT